MNILFFNSGLINRYAICPLHHAEQLDGTQIQLSCLDDIKRFIRRLGADERRAVILWCAPYRGTSSHCATTDTAYVLWRNKQLRVVKLEKDETEKSIELKRRASGLGDRTEKLEYMHIPEQHLRYIPPPSSPESSSQPPPSAPIAKSMDDVKSLGDAEKLLQKRREEIIESGYKQKYNDNELKAIADKGELNDRFLVRLIFGDERSARDGTLGFERNSGRAPYWATTLDMTEAADSDPEIIAGLFGIENFNPNQPFTLAVIDTEKMPLQTQRETFIPTHKKMADFGKKEFSLEEGFTPTTMDAIMNNEFGAEYSEFMADFNKTGKNAYDSQEIRMHAKRTVPDPEKRKNIVARHKMQLEFGANPLFSGNGLTKVTPDNAYADSIGQNYGVVETFTFERDPLQIGDLERMGAVKLIPAKTTRGSKC